MRVVDSFLLAVVILLVLGVLSPPPVEPEAPTMFMVNCYDPGGVQVFRGEVVRAVYPEPWPGERFRGRRVGQHYSPGWARQFELPDGTNFVLVKGYCEVAE